MKICVIGSVGIPASYGGFETLVDMLVEANNVSFTVYCSGKHYSKDRTKKYKNADLVYIPFDANGISSVIYDISSMIHAAVSGQKNFLILGVSGAIFLPILSLIPNIKITTNIDGIEWKREKWKGMPKYFLKLSELMAVKFSTKIISDNDAITKYILNEYQSECQTIAYGGDHAIKSTSDKNINISSSTEPFALSICRIEPENNINLILDAFSQSNLKITFIGNWQNSSYGRELFNKYKNQENLKLLNPIYCLDTLHRYRSKCSVYIHGHSAGGTNPSLVEMMHFSKPIIAFDCKFNRATMENKGYYFKSSNNLVNMIEDISNLDCGDEMIEIAQRRYTWKIIREQYIKLLGFRK